MKKTKLNFINIILGTGFILWPVISVIVLVYIQYKVVFNDEFSVEADNWLGLVVSVMWFRLLMALIIPGMFLVFIRRISSKNSRLKKIFILSYVLIACGILLYSFPYSFWKARLIEPPSNTFEKSYRYNITTITESSETELRFKSHSKSDDVVEFYSKLFSQQGLCLGVQDLDPERRCFPKEQIKPDDRSWTINTVTGGQERKADGLNWGFIHYIGTAEEGYTIVWISLDNSSK